MTNLIVRFKLADGNTLEVYEPPSSGREAMRRGRCPGCGEQLYGYTGRCAAIRELGSDGLVVGASPYACNYGHLTCIRAEFARVVQQLQVPDTVPYGLNWNRGTQRDMLNFLKEHAHDVVEVCFDPLASRYTHYEFRVKEIS